MRFIFSTPVLITPLWQLKTVVFLHWYPICAIPLYNALFSSFLALRRNKLVSLATIFQASLIFENKTGAYPSEPSYGAQI